MWLKKIPFKNKIVAIRSDLGWLHFSLRKLLVFTLVDFLLIPNHANVTKEFQSLLNFLDGTDYFVHLHSILKFKFISLRHVINALVFAKKL